MPAEPMTLRTFRGRPRHAAATVGLALGFRSGLEERVHAELTSQGLDVAYEEVKVKYTKPAKASTYTADFRLPNGIIVETKGQFVTADRQKHCLIKDQHPNLDIRFVFNNPNARIAKKSNTTYAMWCEKNGFIYAKKSVPLEWIAEPKCAG